MLPSNPYIMLEAQEERRQALLREMETLHRLAQAKGRRPALWQCCFACVGERLIVWGSWLKQRSTPASVTQLSSN